MIRILDQRRSPVFANTGAPVAASDESVRPIIEAVRNEGDEALLRYACELDGLGDRPLRLGKEEITAARQQVSPDFIRAAETATANVREFACAQMPREYFREFSTGRKLG